MEAIKYIVSMVLIVIGVMAAWTGFWIQPMAGAVLLGGISAIYLGFTIFETRKAGKFPDDWSKENDRDT